MKFTLSLILTLFCTTAVHGITIETVPVGNPGNTADARCCSTLGPIVVGSVDHLYKIGKYEVTAGQYTQFLNAVAKADPNELYNLAMADPASSEGANIQPQVHRPITATALLSTGPIGGSIT